MTMTPPPTLAPAGPSGRPSLRDGFRGPRLRARVRAALLHLLLSAVVCGGLAGLVLWLMYPSPYFTAAGGGRLIGMIALVDLCIGPALTFAVFDTRKRSLRMDLALIGVVQVAALAYGLHALALGRPVFLTWAVDRFELVSAAEVDPRELRQAPESMRELSWTGPRVVGTTRPESGPEREQLDALVMAGMDLRHLIHRYQPYDALRADVLARAKPVAALRDLNPPAALDAALGDAGLADRRDTLRWAPVSGRHTDLVALIDGERGDLLRVVRLRPW